MLPEMLAPRLIVLACAFAAALSAVSAGEVQSPPRQSAPPPPPSSPASGSVGDDAAEKHARRTACLKDARAKRLVGAQRASFVKNCVENPGET
jgi:hypothetical protein